MLFQADDWCWILNFNEKHWVFVLQQSYTDNFVPFFTLITTANWNFLLDASTCCFFWNLRLQICFNSPSNCSYYAFYVFFHTCEIKTHSSTHLSVCPHVHSPQAPKREPNLAGWFSRIRRPRSFDLFQNILSLSCPVASSSSVGSSLCLLIFPLASLRIFGVYLRCRLFRNVAPKNA